MNEDRNSFEVRANYPRLTLSGRSGDGLEDYYDPVNADYSEQIAMLLQNDMPIPDRLVIEANNAAQQEGAGGGPGTDAMTMLAEGAPGILEKLFPAKPTMSETVRTDMMSRWGSMGQSAPGGHAGMGSAVNPGALATSADPYATLITGKESSALGSSALSAEGLGSGAAGPAGGAAYVPGLGSGGAGPAGGAAYAGGGTTGATGGGGIASTGATATSIPGVGSAAGPPSVLASSGSGAGAALSASAVPLAAMGAGALHTYKSMKRNTSNRRFTDGSYDINPADLKPGEIAQELVPGTKTAKSRDTGSKMQYGFILADDNMRTRVALAAAGGGKGYANHNGKTYIELAGDMDAARRAMAAYTPEVAKRLESEVQAQIKAQSPSGKLGREQRQNIEMRVRREVTQNWLNSINREKR